MVSRPTGQDYAVCTRPRARANPCSQGIQLLLLLRGQVDDVLGVAVPDGLRGLGDRLVVDPPLRSALHEDEARRGLGVLVGERQACNRRLNASGVPVRHGCCVVQYAHHREAGATGRGRLGPQEPRLGPLLAVEVDSVALGVDVHDVDELLGQGVLRRHREWPPRRLDEGGVVAGRSNWLSSTKRSSFLKSSSVSPGNPTIRDVRRAMPGTSDLSLPTRYLISFSLLRRFIALRIGSLMCCKGTSRYLQTLSSFLITSIR